MENRQQGQMLPFERNRYYPGKLLTSMDFEAEQDYMMNQRRFANSLVLGQGILCGLSVFNLDDFSIMIESGVAVDGRGREIVIEKSLVKKLSAIDGFESLSGSRALLCLAYSEEGVHPVYAVNRQERNQEYEFNRISEGFRLFLVDAPAGNSDYRMETEFYSTAVLTSDEDYTVGITIPSIVSSGRKVKLSLRIVKQRESSRDIEVDAVLAAPAFTAADGSHELRIQTGNVHLEAGESRTFEYWMVAENREYESTSMIAGEKDIRIGGDGRMPGNGNAVNLRTSIQHISPKNLVTREIGKLNLEMRMLGQRTDFVPLAEFSLMRTDNAYIIDGISENGVKRYIPVPAQENLRAEFQACFGEEREEFRRAEAAGPKSEVLPASRFREPVCMSGTCEIPLGMRAKKGTVKYSGEIVHGLGKGEVWVSLGVCYLKEDAALGKETRHTVFGVPELFTGRDKAAVPRVETAVRVANDKGSFTAAVRLLEDSQAAVLRLTWMAVRFQTEEENAGETAGSGIVAEMPTVIMEPGARHYFGVRFQNMEPCSLAYELTEENSGEISRDGIYTAPAREGIYEIYISCERYPAIGTYAYAAVRKPGGMEV